MTEDVRMIGNISESKDCGCAAAPFAVAELSDTLGQSPTRFASCYS